MKTHLLLFLFVMANYQAQAQLISETIKQHIKDRIENSYGIGISIAYIQGNEVEYFQMGSISYDSQKKVDENTIFEIGSITKTFTTLLLAIAVEEGKAKLDDPIQKYLPKNAKVPQVKGKEITFRHLATHTSALPRLPDNLDVYNENPYADYDEKKLFEFLNKYKLTREIGDLYEYSNLGMGLLGHTLGLIYKKDYSELLKEKIFNPLKLSSAQIRNQFPKDFENIAYPHSANKTLQMWDFDVLAGAGALKMNAKDLATYLKAQLGVEKSKSYKAMLLTHQIEKQIDAGMKIALGWHIFEKDTMQIVWHNGATNGSTSFVAFNPKKQKAVVVLSNTNDNVDDIGMTLITGKENLKKIRKKINLSPETFKNYVGVYDLGQGFKIHITLDGKRLMAQATNQANLEIFPESENMFFYTVVDAQLEFVKDEQGAITSLILHQNGLKLSGKKE